MNTLPEFNSLDCAVLLDAGFTPAAVRLFLDTGFTREAVLDAARDRVQAKQKQRE